MNTPHQQAALPALPDGVLHGNPKWAKAGEYISDCVALKPFTGSEPLYTAEQMKEYALQAFGAMEAENQRLKMALQMLYDETADYIKLNNLGGMDNQCMKLARAALAKPEYQQEQKS